MGIESLHIDTAGFDLLGVGLVEAGHQASVEQPSEPGGLGVTGLGEHDGAGAVAAGGRATVVVDGDEQRWSELCGDLTPGRRGERVVEIAGEDHRGPEGLQHGLGSQRHFEVELLLGELGTRGTNLAATVAGVENHMGPVERRRLGDEPHGSTGCAHQISLVPHGLDRSDHTAGRNHGAGLIGIGKWPEGLFGRASRHGHHRLGGGRGAGRLGCFGGGRCGLGGRRGGWAL